jgi:predicted PurR-regulated permease PerM
VKAPRPLIPHSLRNAAAIAAVFLGMYAVYLLFAQLLHIFLLAFAAIILAFIVHYPLDALARIMPRPLAAGLTFLLLIGIVVGFGVLGAPMVEEQGSKLLEKLPRTINKLHAWWRNVERTAAMEALGAEVPGGVRGRIREELNGVVDRAVPLAMSVIALAGSALVVMVLAIFLAYNPRAYVRGIVRLVPRHRARHVVVLMRRLGDTMGSWTVGTLVSMTLVGVLTGVGTFAIGLESWFVLAILGFIGEFVPYIGPTAAAVPGILVAFADSPRTGVYACIVYTIVQGLESYVLQPVIMKRAVRIQPALLLLWQLAMAAAFGIVGIFIATPLLAILQETIEYAYIHKTLRKPLRHTVQPA